jgi:glycosyltransferase involved in cell wall biosynthesis
VDRPLVSIVVTCHNRVDRLPETMETVFAQSYRPVEIVVVDDGSTDGTPELMARYGDRVRYHRHENRGIAGTRTVGGRLARGELIAFQDDDDLMPPRRIEVLLDALQRFPGAVMATGDWELIDEAGTATGQRSRFELPADAGPVLLEDGRRAVLWPQLTPVPHTTLFRKADGERIGWFDERFFHACEDTDFFARCGALGPVVYVPEVVSLYRRGPGLSSRSVLQAYSRFLLYDKHLREGVGGDEELARRLESRMLGTLKQLARYESDGVPFPEVVSRERLRAAVRALPVRDRIAYHRAVNLRMPIRRLGRRLLGR